MEKILRVLSIKKHSPFTVSDRLSIDRRTLKSFRDRRSLMRYFSALGKKLRRILTTDVTCNVSTLTTDNCHTIDR
ncbi:hypothetical protein [Chroococcidiopsis sp. SAG 2025]|uniref:hypothetical protein n=1 Tax=Chroococcidiopsis sp. SAG 2025 TaxID=171389 RepID=UPI0029373056|nr:hypothetical protein [Chroococcidiopsis sp. SAG 2025]